MDKKKIRRGNLLPHECCRCGNDFMNGKAIIYLPFEKRYIGFCSICSLGLEISHLFSKKNPTDTDWQKFWNEEVKNG